MIDAEGIKEGEGLPQGEKFGKQVADTFGSAVGTAGEKLDAVIDYVDNTSARVKDKFNRIREEGWEGAKKKTIEYARQEPLSALLIATGAGFLLGWILKRGK